MSIGSAVLMISVTGCWVSSELPKSPWKTPEIQVQYCWKYEPVRPSCSFAFCIASGVAVLSPREEEVEDVARHEPDHHEDQHRDREERGEEGYESAGDEAIHGIRKCERRAGDVPGPPFGSFARRRRTPCAAPG